MTLTQLQVFVAVVETGSFSRAGQALHMTQSAVSHAVASLEAALGASLLERERRGVAATELGERVLQHAREMLAQAEQIRQEAAASRGLAIGRVRVGSFSSVSARLLPPVVAAFRRRYPGIEVVVLEGTDQEVQQWISERAVDVGIVTAPCESFEVLPLPADAMVAVLPVGHPLATRGTVGVDDLAAEPFVLSRGGCEPVIRMAFQDRGLTPLVRYEALEVATIFAMVREGLGVALVPETALSDTAQGVAVCKLDPPVWRQLALAARSLTASSPAVQAFIAELRDAIDTNHP